MLDKNIRLEYGKNALNHIKKFYNLKLQTYNLEKLYICLIGNK